MLQGRNASWSFRTLILFFRLEGSRAQSGISLPTLKLENSGKTAALL
jgi:hypothetical protein